MKQVLLVWHVRPSSSDKICHHLCAKPTWINVWIRKKAGHFNTPSVSWFLWEKDAALCLDPWDMFLYRLSSPHKGACPGRASDDVASGSSGFSMSTNLPSRPKMIFRGPLSHTPLVICAAEVSLILSCTWAPTNNSGSWVLAEKPPPLSLPSSSFYHLLPTMLMFGALGMSNALFNPHNLFYLKIKKEGEKK